ncbi:amidohydrolase family protein [Breznakiellaceae bacterium SP9]
MVKIDFHVHITPPEIRAKAPAIAEREPYFGLLASNPKNKFAGAQEVVAELDRAGFDAAVVFGFAFKDPGLCRAVNDYVIDAVHRFPGRLYGFAVVPPQAPGAAAEIERCHAAGLCGVGELFPTGQDFRIEDGAQTRAFAECCMERSLPVLIHTNEPVGHYYPGKTDTALVQLERFVEQHPRLRIVLAHWGGGLLFYELMKELRCGFANVYYDTAASPFLYSAQIYKIACALGLERKVLFGSDFPLLPLSRYVREINASGITLEQRELLFGRNALELLRPDDAFFREQPAVHQAPYPALL